ncbi:MAG: hypothetical protein PUC32_00340 [Oscillospiraceae bacterium]|nr:hypothetical protein [Oscillospiraceae bacterium]
MINPFTVKKLLDNKNEFAANHPEFFSFAREVFGNKLEEGTEISINVARPNQEPKNVTMTVTKSDLAFLKALQDLL